MLIWRQLVLSPFLDTLQDHIDWLTETLMNAYGTLAFGCTGKGLMATSGSCSKGSSVAAGIGAGAGAGVEIGAGPAT